MAEQNKPNEPNEASRKSKAEGDRMSGPGKDEQGGITNRPLDEEQSNQEALPPRGEAKPGAHAGHGGPDSGTETDR